MRWRRITWDTNFSGIDELIEEFLMDNPYDHHACLDIGCGLGYSLDKIRELINSDQVYGIDTSRKALVKAKDKSSNVTLICASAECLPFNDKIKFDIIVAGHVLDSSDEEYLKEMLHEVSSYTSLKSRFYMTFDWHEACSLKQNSAPFRNALANSGWEVIHQESYDKANEYLFAHGLFCVAEKN